LRHRSRSWPLREGALTLQEENLGLRERVKALEDALAIRGRIRFDGSTYWIDRDGNADGPFCQRCYDANGKLLRLQDWEDCWICFECKNTADKR
jgi:hypothetical protein